MNERSYASPDAAASPAAEAGRGHRPRRGSVSSRNVAGGGAGAAEAARAGVPSRPAGAWDGAGVAQPSLTSTTAPRPPPAATAAAALSAASPARTTRFVDASMALHAPAPLR